jgi:hypothetical protein
MRICFIPKNIDGSGWYRCFFPAHYLVERGHFAQAPPMGFFRPDGQPVEVYPDGQLPEGWLTCKFGEWPEADVYVFQMSNDPNVPNLVNQIHEAGKKVVFEVDDDLLHVPKYNPFNDDPQWFHQGVKMADAVVVSTPSLKRSYGFLNSNVVVLRNRLFWPMWETLAPVYERREWRKLRVGWMGIMEYHTADLEVLKPWLGKWLKAHPDVEFVSVGSPEVHKFLGVPENQRVTTDKCDFRHHELAYITSVMDIGLVPLARNRFNEGKSYLKGLEYSACGIVPLATPSGQYKELIEDGEDGFLCETPADFERALNILIEDRERLERMGRAAYEKAKAWTYEKHIDEWEDFFESVCADAIASRALWTPEPMSAVS